MAYGNESRQGQVVPPAAWNTPISTAAVADNLSLFKVLAPITVLRVGLHVTTTITTTAPVVDFDRRVLFGSDTGRVQAGVTTMTFPAVAGLTAGVTVYKNVRVDLSPGDEVTVQVTTASAAGAGIPFLEYIPRQEDPRNFTELLAAT